jgi:hypothetical protein
MHKWIKQNFSSMDAIELVRGGDDGGRSIKKTRIVFKDFSETKRKLEMKH